ncbi:methyltransferase domain-containing protein [Roseovarius mucosus]|uniref:methyltransferase domain-containing protein n=1 Tax=Roseovarius mucosus TaxID=215743 RepID=UPI003BA9D987
MQQSDLFGLCTICGHVGTMLRGDQRSVRESYACSNCRFTLRWRDQAGVIVDEFGRGRAISLDQLVERGLLNDISIYEPALRGPFVARLKGLQNYVRSYFRPDEPLGDVSSDGVRNEDLTRLTFQDNSFDLIITSDVMEHLPDIEKAFAETLRVLRPGGIHVFSIPNDYPLPDRTETRARLEQGTLVHLKPERYHNAGDGTKCLVFTDYGSDLSEIIRSLGGHLAVVRRSGVQEPCYTNATFVMRKVASPEMRSVHSAVQPPVQERAKDLECPICKGSEYEDFNGRQNARCSTCRAVERNRLMWMILDRLGGFEPGKRVLQLAPEPSLARKFNDLSGDAYHGAEVNAERFQKSQNKSIRMLDLCTDLAAIPDASYDVILHNHVLEHVPCDVREVLRQLDRILAPGGLHFLSVPIRGEKTDEDLSPDLTDAERQARFGEKDHMRIFGSSDLRDLLQEVWGTGPHLIEPIEIFDRDDLRRAAIPTAARQGASGHSVFHYCKGAHPPAVVLAEARSKSAPKPERTIAPGASAAVRTVRNEVDASYPAEDAPPGSQIMLGLEALRRDNPWPDFPWEDHAPFKLALDANGDGGRDIVLREIIAKDVRLMVEVGCFLGGSALHWLTANPDLNLIGVDPWDGNWADYVLGMAHHPSMSLHVEHLSDTEVKRIARLLSDYGNFAVALNNLRDFRHRFYPVRRFSPEALYYLRRREIPVDMIYIDAFKHRADLDAAYALYPDAILCGDDWLWPDESGCFVMQEAIKEFARDHGFEIEAKRQTWVLHK